MLAEIGDRAGRIDNSDFQRERALLARAKKLQGATLSIVGTAAAETVRRLDAGDVRS